MGRRRGGREGRTELECGSHVSRLLSKLPHDLRIQFKRYIDPIRTPIPTLLDFSYWLEKEVRVQQDEVPFIHSRAPLEEPPDRQKGARSNQSPAVHSTTVLLGCDSPVKAVEPTKTAQPSPCKAEQPQKYCPFCNNNQHYFNQCTTFKQLTKDQKVSWIKKGKRCWRCGRDHQTVQCYLKARCQTCNLTHLEVLHEVNARPEKPAPEASQPVTYYLDPARRGGSVLLKMVKVCLFHGNKKMETYAILDDGSERTMLLHSAAQELGLHGRSEELALRTIRQDVRAVPGRSVSFSVASASQPQKRFRIEQAFTSAKLGLSTHSYPLKALQKAYHHLRDLPLHSFSQAQPLLLIGSDYPHLLTPVERVHLGPPGGPAALRTRLGWTLQDPFKVPMHQSSTPQCLLTGNETPSTEHRCQVTKPRQRDVIRTQLCQESIRAEAHSKKRNKPSRSAGRDGSSFHEPADLRTSSFCGHVSVTSAQPLPDPGGFSSYQELLEASIRACHGAATPTDPAAEDVRQAELALLRTVQRDCFPEEFILLSTGKPVPAASRLLRLAPEFDAKVQLIRVGGRLRRCESLEEDALHPIVLDPHHPITKLIIQDGDSRLMHPGPDRVVAELRRRFWILRGRQAVRKHQHGCAECRRWRSNSVILRMTDLSHIRLRLSRPHSISTGVVASNHTSSAYGQRRSRSRTGPTRGPLPSDSHHSCRMQLAHFMDNNFATQSWGGC